MKLNDLILKYKIGQGTKSVDLEKMSKLLTMDIWVANPNIPPKKGKIYKIKTFKETDILGSIKRSLNRYGRLSDMDYYFRFLQDGKKIPTFFSNLEIFESESDCCKYYVDEMLTKLDNKKKRLEECKESIDKLTNQIEFYAIYI